MSCLPRSSSRCICSSGSINENHWPQNPGIGSLQKSFWLDPEELDVNAYQAECFRAERPDRALFIRQLIATYHKGKTSRSISVATPVVRQPRNATVSTGPVNTVRGVLSHLPRPGFQETGLSAAQVNEISRTRGLGMSWQPGNVYRVGKAANGKSCLLQLDSQGRELARYGSWSSSNCSG